MIFPVESILVCDDIRQEDNGKYILIGVYTGSILVGEFPSTLPLRALIVGLPGSYPERLAVEWKLDDTLLARMEAKRGPEGDVNETFTLALPMVPISLTAPGTLRLTAHADEKTQVLMERRVLLFTRQPAS